MRTRHIVAETALNATPCGMSDGKCRAVRQSEQSYVDGFPIMAGLRDLYFLRISLIISSRKSERRISVNFPNPERFVHTDIIHIANQRVM
jgi:hypothetical protein